MPDITKDTQPEAQHQSAPLASATASHLLAAIGYCDPETGRQRGIDAFIELLVRHGVSTIVDIRWLASGGYGTSSYNGNTLRKHLNEAGIRYVRFREELGNPDRHDPDMKFFRQLIATEGDQRLRPLIELVESESGKVGIMCACRDLTECHRNILASAMQARGSGVDHIR